MATGTAQYRFGVHLSGVMDADGVNSFVTQAEGMGYDTVTVADHIRAEQMSAVPLITAAAMASTRLKVGALVFCNDYRHPAMLARELATLDVLSGGRVLAGIGAGWLASDYTTAGIPLDRPGVRIDRLTEAIAVLKGLWQNDTFSFAGKHYTLNDCESTPRPVQRPHPKLLIGAGGDRMLKLAAREADIINLTVNQRAGTPEQPVLNRDAANSDPEQFDARVQTVKDAAGTRFATLELSSYAYNVIVTDDRDRYLDATAEAMGVSREWVLSCPMILIGTIAEIRADIEAKRDRYGITYWIFPGGQMEQLAPIVAELASAGASI